MAYVQLASLDKIEKQLGIDKYGETQTFFTQTCAIHMDKYVPFDTGIFAGTVVKNNYPTGNVTNDRIIYSQNYGEYIYYGISKNGNLLNYNTDKHEHAGSYWDKRMVNAEIDDVIKEVQEFSRQRNGKK